MSTQIAKTNGTKTVKDLMGTNSFRESVADLIPKHLTTERLLKTALVAISKSPKLMNCTADSLLKAVMDAAALGLDFAGQMGSGYLVPFGDQATFIPGYRGLIDLARRSGQVAGIFAELVYENDEFIREMGTSPRVIHRPVIKDRGEVIGCYAVARYTDPKLDPQFEFMDLGQLEAIRKRSKAANNGPWVTDTEEMQRKTVIRRLCKYLPMSVELAKAFDHLDAAMGLATVADSEPRQSLLERVKGKNEVADVALRDTLGGESRVDEDVAMAKNWMEDNTNVGMPD